MPYKKVNKKNNKPAISKRGFNPVKNDPTTGNADKIIWSSQALNAALEGLNQGFKLKANPFYENNTKLLKADLLFERTPEEMVRFKECMNDILEFAKECQLMTPQGIKYVQMRDYQKRYLKHLQENRLSIYLSCRQSAKTTTSAIFILWFSLFNYDKNCLVLGAKYSIAKEILDKIKNIFYYLPYYLRPGIRKWNDSEIVFDNGCRIMAEATTVNSGISFTFHCVLADEFAHVPSNIVDKFYNQIFPTITAGAARFMITSTQNGFNLFYKLYKSAEAGENEYAAFKTDWYEVPEWNPNTQCWEKRTEEWHRRMAANLGGEEKFQKQFGTNFDVTGNTLIAAKKIRKLQVESQEFRPIDMPGLLHSDSFRWSPLIEDISQIKNMYLTLTIDISEGIGQDSDIIYINRLEWDNMLEKTVNNCIGICEVKDISVPEFAEVTVDFISKFCNQNNIILSFESNTFGGLFYKSVNTYSDNHPELNFDAGITARYERDMFSEGKGIDTKAGNSSTKYILGFKVTSSTKKGACKLFKAFFEDGLIRNNSTRFISQLENFIDVKGNGSYEAGFGHDDQVMCAVQLAALSQTLKYKLLVESFEGDLKTNGNGGEEFVDYYGEMIQPSPNDPLYYVRQFNKGTFNPAYKPDENTYYNF